MIDWDAIKVSKENMGLICKIADRVQKEVQIDDRMSLVMDIEVAHCHIPLDLQKLLDAPSFDFGHDVGGIRQNLNRETGKIDNCFLPRCALPEVKTA